MFDIKLILTKAILDFEYSGWLVVLFLPSHLSSIKAQMPCRCETQQLGGPEVQQHIPPHCACGEMPKMIKCEGFCVKLVTDLGTGKVLVTQL